MTLSSSEFGKILGVTRQAVFNAIKKGYLVSSDGEIDLELDSTEAWATNSPKKAEMWLKYRKRTSKKSKKDTVIAIQKNENEEKKDVKNDDQIDVTVKQKKEIHSDTLTPAEISMKTSSTRLKYEQERVIKLMQENARLRNETIYRDQFREIEEKTINFLITTLKNVGNVLVMDLEKKILANGGITNADFFEVEDQLMDTVQKMIEFKKKELKNMGYK